MGTKKTNLYLSFDIESDGCTPILNNMISIGFYGLDDNFTKHFEYEANIQNLEGHFPEEKCMTTFWNLPENQVAWNYVQQNKRNFVDVMVELSDHFKRLAEQHKLIFVASPASFDWMFFKCYYEMAKTIHDKSSTMFDIGYSCQCSSTLWNLYKKKNKLSYNDASKLLKKINNFDQNKEHIAIEDAKCQGVAHVKIIQMLEQS